MFHQNLTIADNYDSNKHKQTKQQIYQETTKMKLS